MCARFYTFFDGMLINVLCYMNHRRTNRGALLNRQKHRPPSSTVNDK